MAELVKLIVDLLTLLWPFRVVRPWEHGVYIVLGRWVWVLSPGVKVVPPYVCELHPVSIVPEIYTTPLQIVTLRDGKTLNFSASVKVRVVDARAAYTKVGHWAETVVELAASVLARELADAEVERFDPARGKRGRLMGELLSAINAEILQYGLEVLSMSMTNFAIGLKTYRHLLDRATLHAEETRP